MHLFYFTISSLENWLFFKSLPPRNIILNNYLWKELSFQKKGQSRPVILLTFVYIIFLSLKGIMMYIVFFLEILFKKSLLNLCILISVFRKYSRKYSSSRAFACTKYCGINCYVRGSLFYSSSNTMNSYCLACMKNQMLFILRS